MKRENKSKEELFRRLENIVAAVEKEKPCIGNIQLYIVREKLISIFYINLSIISWHLRNLYRFFRI